MDALLTYPLPLRVVLAVGLPIYVALLWVVTRLLLQTREQLRCPVTGQEASVLFVRGPDGFKDDVVSCSLLEDEPGSTCGKQCLHPAGA